MLCMRCDRRIGYPTIVRQMLSSGVIACPACGASESYRGPSAGRTVVYLLAAILYMAAMSAFHPRLWEERAVRLIPFCFAVFLAETFLVWTGRLVPDRDPEHAGGGEPVKGARPSATASLSAKGLMLGGVLLLAAGVVAPLLVTGSPLLPHRHREPFGVLLAVILWGAGALLLMRAGVGERALPRWLVGVFLASLVLAGVLSLWWLGFL